jgi:hypothetical protein
VALGASEESMYATAFILMLHNILESKLEEFIVYTNHNPCMDEENFKDKIVNKMGFARKVESVRKYIPNDICNKLIKFNELRNKYAHKIIDVGKTKWKQVSRKEMNKYLDDYSDILRNLGPKCKKAQEQYFKHSDILDEAYDVL